MEIGHITGYLLRCRVALSKFCRFFFTFHQQHLIVIQQQIALLVTEKIARPCLGFVAAGKVFKIEAILQQFLARGFGFARWVQFFYNAAVAAQDIIDVAHQVVAIAIELVIIIIAAQVVTEFFIRTAM